MLGAYHPPAGEQLVLEGAVISGAGHAHIEVFEARHHGGMRMAERVCVAMAEHHFLWRDMPQPCGTGRRVAAVVGSQ